MDDYVNLAEACRRLKMSPRTLARRIAAHGVTTWSNGMDARDKLLLVSDLPLLARKPAKRVVPA